DMRHDVEIPSKIPEPVVGNLPGLAFAGESGVAVPNVDLPIRPTGEVGHGSDVLLDGDIHSETSASDPLGHATDGLRIDSGDHHLRPFCAEAVGERFADTVAGAGNHHDLVIELHLVAYLVSSSTGTVSTSSRQS